MYKAIPYSSTIIFMSDNLLIKNNLMEMTGKKNKFTLSKLPMPDYLHRRHPTKTRLEITQCSGMQLPKLCA